MRRAVVLFLSRNPVMKGQSHEGALSFSNPNPVISDRSFPVTVISGHGHFRSLRIFGVSKCEYTVCAIEWTAMRFLDIFIVFARNNLMNIMCKVGDYILILNNVEKKHPDKYPETQYIEN